MYCDPILNCSICIEIMFTKVFLLRPEQMEVAGCEIGTVWRMIVDLSDIGAVEEVWVGSSDSPRHVPSDFHLFRP
jgi:hypothetical protein